MVLTTPLHSRHADLGATFTEFAGYDMPVVYGSINDEHHAVRNAAGLFDVSHMSNLFIEGPGAAAAISQVSTRSVQDLAIGRGQYGVILRDDGTILDDVFTFRLEEERFFMVPNAGQNQAVAEHLAAHGHDLVIADETRDWAILALQGPAARGILAAASEDPAPKFHRIVSMTLAGVDCLVSGTGYTGEKGVELYIPQEGATTVWDHLMAVGEAHGLRAIGLGARDTLRLEKGYALAGNEFAGGRTPLEANLGWLIDWEHEFLGKASLLAQRDAGHPLLVGLVQEKGVPRHGYRVLQAGAPIGEITSGTKSPTTGTGIALAYLTGVKEGDKVDVEVRARTQAATVTKPPFA